MKRIAAIILLLFSALPLGGCEYFFGNSWTIREKLTITVETPNGERSGFSVTEWKVEKTADIFHSLGGTTARQKGEAVVVEVTPGKHLFALLGKPHPILGLLTSAKTRGRLEEEFDRFSEESGISGPVREEEYPMLVTFENLASPSSVKEVKPYDLAAAFGPGVKLKAITLDTTEEPIATGVIKKLLPWLGSYPEPPLCRPKSGTDFSFCATEIHHGDFIRG